MPVSLSVCPFAFSPSPPHPENNSVHLGYNSRNEQNYEGVGGEVDEGISFLVWYEMKEINF